MVSDSNTIARLDAWNDILTFLSFYIMMQVLLEPLGKFARYLWFNTDDTQFIVRPKGDEGKLVVYIPDKSYTGPKKLEPTEDSNQLPFAIKMRATITPSQRMPDIYMIHYQPMI